MKLTIEELNRLVNTIDINEAEVIRTTRNARISARHLGRPCPTRGIPRRPHSEEHKEYLRSLFKGREGIPHTEESRAKISAANRGKPGTVHTPEHLARMSELMSGRTLSEDTRKKISEARTGKPNSAESNKKNSESNAKFEYVSPKGVFATRKLFKEAHTEYSWDQLYDWTRNNKNGFARQARNKR